MANPGRKVIPQRGLTGNDLEFLAEYTDITIIPSFRLAQLSFIDSTYGPFRPSFPVKVPLWLAIYLKKNKKCQIKAPAWMELDALQKHLRQEQEEEEQFLPIPYHYIEISDLLLANASDDIPHAERVRTVLADITEARGAKINKGLKEIQVGTAILQLNNIAAMELHHIRPFALGAMDSFAKVAREEGALSEEGARAGVASSQASGPPSSQQAVRKLRRFGR